MVLLRRPLHVVDVCVRVSEARAEGLGHRVPLHGRDFGVVVRPAGYGMSVRPPVGNRTEADVVRGEVRPEFRAERKRCIVAEGAYRPAFVVGNACRGVQRHERPVVEPPVAAVGELVLGRRRAVEPVGDDVRPERLIERRARVVGIGPVARLEHGIGGKRLHDLYGMLPEPQELRERGRCAADPPVVGGQVVVARRPVRVALPPLRAHERFDAHIRDGVLVCHGRRKPGDFVVIGERPKEEARRKKRD